MIITFDIGGTSIKYGLIDEKKGELTFVERGEVDTDAKVIKGPGILKKVESIIQENQKTYEIKGIAISTAGMVDAQKGSIIYANENIPEYTGMGLKAYYERVFGIPCWMENDVNAAALGEAVFGAAQGAQSALMLTIGTGVGGALIIDEQVYHGYSGSAGEIGYMWLNGKHFENTGSTTALVHYVEEKTSQKGLNGKIIFERAKQGDLMYVEAIDVLCRNIIQGISNCVCLFNPQVVVLGGGIMAQKEYLEPIMQKYMQKFLNEEMYRNTTLKFATLQNQAGMAGAYAYWLKQEL